MSATHTADRIRKLLAKGLAPESIARKIGRPGPDGVARVEAERAKLAPARSCSMCGNDLTGRPMWAGMCIPCHGLEKADYDD